ncbi:hypothetical protein D9M72_623610 [compost metagenome]
MGRQARRSLLRVMQLAVLRAPLTEAATRVLQMFMQQHRMLKMRVFSNWLRCASVRCRQTIRSVSARHFDCFSSRC